MLRNLLLTTFGVLVAMLVVAYITTDPTSQEQPKVAQVEHLFDTIAFSGFGEGGPDGTGPYLRRWTQPVHIVLVGKPDHDSDGTTWRDQVATLAKVYDALPNLDVSVTGEEPYHDDYGQDGVLQIVTIPLKGLDSLPEGLSPQTVGTLQNMRAGCVILGDDAAQLHKVTILISDAITTGHRTDCLGEKLALALGYNIETKFASDVFRVRDGVLSFHGLGRAAAALVYDPAMEPGMRRDVALSLAENVLKEKGFQ